jgi:phosphohistidine phosphatase
LHSVDIDGGTFKYVLVQCGSHELVRGYNGCEYHADVLAKTQRQCPDGVTLNCVGGGRIEHRPAERTVVIYGYSQGFGRADHARASNLCRAHFGDGYDITWNNDGY